MLKTLTLLSAAFGLFACATANVGGSPDGKPIEVSQTSASSQGSGKMCGGIAGLKCAGAKEYCAYPSGTCLKIADVSGTCKVKPDLCEMIYAPVCGCDGKTYSNSCVAAAAGVSVAANGKCKPN